MGHWPSTAPLCETAIVHLNAWTQWSVWSTSHWKTQMGYPCSRSLSFNAYDHRLALQAAFHHLFNLSLLSPSLLEFSIENSRFTSLCLPLLCYSTVRRMTIMRPGRLPLLHTNISHVYQAHCVLPHIHVNSHISNVLLMKVAYCSQHTKCASFMLAVYCNFVVMYCSLFLY